MMERIAGRIDTVVDALVSGRARDKLPYILLVLLIIGYVAMSYYTVDWLVHDVTNSWEPENRSRAYISDEIYYVSTARNIAVKVFWDTGIRAPGDKLYYTVFFEVFPPKNILLEHARETGVEIYIMTYKTRVEGVETIVIVDQHGNPINTTTKSMVFTNITSGRVTNAVYIGVDSVEQLREFIDRFNQTNWTVVDAIPGWAYPDLPGVNNYWNLEHPPLAKYVIALFIMVFGDNPYVWRTPSIICGVVMLVFAYLTALEVLREILGRRYGRDSETYARWIALAVPGLMLADAVFRNMTVVALLDTYVGAFTSIGVYVFVKTVNSAGRSEKVKKILVEKIYRRIWILAGLAKMNGLFIFIADVLEKLVYERGVGIYRKILGIIKYLIIVAVEYLVLFFIISIPLIGVAGGLNSWIQQSLIGALRWHTVQKTPLTGNVPPWSTPLDWLLGTRPWILWVHGNSVGEVAGSSYVYLSTFILGIILFPATFKLNRYRRLWLSFYGIYAGWLLLYLIGNKTLYSFYIIQFEPLLIALGVSSLALVFLRTREIPEWYRDFRSDVRVFLRETVRYERLAVWTAVVVAWIFSYYLHAPWHKGSVYTDITSIYVNRVLGGQEWYVEPGSVSLPLPYIHFFFEYPPFIGVLWIVAEAIASIRTGAESLNIFYTVQALYMLVAMIMLADDMVWTRSRLKSTPWEKLSIVSFFLMPATIIYSIYNWDIIALALALRGLRLYYEGKHRTAGILFGWSLATKIFPGVFALVLLKEEYRKARKLIPWIIIGVASVSWLLLVRSGSLHDILQWHMKWYIEGSWILLIARDPFDRIVINASRGLMVLSVLFAVLVPLKKELDAFEKVYIRGTVALALILFFNYVFTPQMVMQIEPLLWIIMPTILFPVLGAMDVSTALVILSWFDLDNPFDKWALPSIASYIKCFALLFLALWLVYRYMDVRIEVKLEIKRPGTNTEKNKG